MLDSIASARSALEHIPVLSSAPSQVLAIRQENASQNSVTLLWQEPDQPNGVILEYDIKYFEKVRWFGVALFNNVNFIL